MDTICRICLSLEVHHDITELPKGIEDETKTYTEIMIYCVDVTIESESKITTNLCGKCYYSLIEIYNFKKQAINNDTYMKKLESNKEVYVIDDCDRTSNTRDSFEDADLVIDTSSIPSPFQIKTDTDVKDEVNFEGFHSDDELLSVLKKMKNEYCSEEVKENESTEPVKKKKGRKKNENKSTKKDTQMCDECGEEVRNINSHMKSHIPNSLAKEYKCTYCDKVFSRCSTRYKHVKFKHLGYREHCELCNKDVVNLKAHNSIIHDANNLKYECDVCGRRFISPSRVKEHKICAHTKETPFHCDICKKGFRTKNTMILHKRQVHDKEKSHLCQICSKSFFKKYHLIKHIRSHTKEKPYECTICGKWYSCTTSLKTHQLTHTTAKDFACDYCDMTFALQKYAVRHMVVHTKEKKYSCKYCGVSFARSDHRQRHEKFTHERHFRMLAKKE